MIELECLAAAWAMHKCHMYLAGTPFNLIVNHQPLVPIFNSYSLDQVENPRLQRLLMHMKTRSYQFQTQWRKGSQHAVADALYRTPSSIPTRDDTLDEDDLQYAARAIRTCIQQDGQGGTCIRFADIKTAAAADVDYQRLVDAVLHGFPSSRRSLPACLVPYWNGREHLSVDSGIVLKGPRASLSPRHCVLACYKICTSRTKVSCTLNVGLVRSSTGRSLPMTSTTSHLAAHPIVNISRHSRPNHA